MSRLYFRPIPVLSLFTLAMLAALIALGVWQLERRQWKLALIADVDARMAAAPAPLSVILALPRETREYRRVALTGRFDPAHEAYVYTLDADGKPGYRVVAPFETRAGWVLADRGFVPPALRDVAKRQPPPAGPVTLTAIWRYPKASGWFTPPPDAAQHVAYVRDLSVLTKLLPKHAYIDGALAEAEASPADPAWPHATPMAVNFRNDHLQYAITWFALAAGLIGVYLTYHRSVGRLGWR